LRLFDKDDRLLGEADDGKLAPGRRPGGMGGGGRMRGPATTDPALDLTMPRGQGEVKLVVKDLLDRGGVGFTYRVTVQPVERAFQLSLGDPQVAIPRGATALIPVTVTRGGYNGPIRLAVRGIPGGQGVTVIPGLVPAGQTRGVVGLVAAPDSTLAPGDVQVVGRAEDGQAVVASQTIVFAESTISTPGFGMAGKIPSYTRPFLNVTAAVIQPGPIRLKPGVSKLVVPQGGTAELPVQVDRSSPEKKRYKLAALAPPTGVGVAEVEIGDTAATTTVKVTAAADAPLGEIPIGLVASAPGNTAAPAIAAVMAAVEVVRPATRK
jgi:hypothetical protein